MGKIRILSENISNQIAAGEVVERPASVVKELVENSIDAGATRIQVHIEDGGKKKIRVIDNGEGMIESDAKTAFKRHATSKISDADDLHRIRSLGFRGEALSSIASVSMITLKTRQQSQPKPVGFESPPQSRAQGRDEYSTNAGVEIRLEGGQIKETKPVGFPGGTEIVVADLFYNVPARQKFLKATRTEGRHITEVVVNAALGHPEVELTLTHNGREVVRTPQYHVGYGAQRAGTSLHNRIADLLGDDFLKCMQEVSLNHPHLTIHGWVNAPGYGAASNKDQYLFVNQRRIDNRTVYGAVRKAFGGILGRGEYPRFLLFLEIDPALIDVNVHPRKEEVRFVNEGTVFNLVRQTVEKAISSQSTAHSAQFEGDRGPMRLRDAPSFPASTPNFPLPQTKSAHRTTQEQLQDEWSESRLEQQTILQAHNLYLITENPSAEGGLALYDQHAVHERILYEKFVADFTKAKESAESQTLLMPVTLSLSATDFETLMENKKTLEKIGLALDEFGGNTVKVGAVPSVLKNRDLRALLNELLSNLSDLGGLKGSPQEATHTVDLQTHRVLSTLACRSAIKAGDRLTPLQAQELLRQLHELETNPSSPSGLRRTNYTCPHGRPVKAIVTERELEKMFRRS